MLSLQEAHFSSLPSQSNIYGLSTLTTKKTVSKVLIASLKRKVFCVEYAKSKDLWIPSTREVQFTYIPSSAEIISIDTFNRSSNDHDFVVGITFIKNGESLCGQYLNIYSDWQPGGECVLDKIAQGCQTIELDFVPYHLTHAPLGKEMVWLLSGSDRKVHVYREDPQSQSFTERPPSECFPEFEALPGIAYRMHVKQMGDAVLRVSAVGCENGVVRVALVKTCESETEVLQSVHVQHDSQISVLQLFCDCTAFPTPSFLPRAEVPAESAVHLLVGSMLEKGVVYRDVLRNGFAEPRYLPHSDRYDCTTSSCVADVDLDGRNEVLLGTYGQELLAYKWDTGHYGLLWQRSFSFPLHALDYVDLMGDGIKELLVLSTEGLHILQYNPEQIAQLCSARISLLQTFLNKE